jgi:hypothetical protein
MEPDVPRCPHCPVDPGRPCEGLGVRRLCELVDPNHAAYNPAYRSLLGDLAGDAAGSTGAAVQDAPTRLGVGESLTLLRTMNACPHRSARTDCGCAGLGRCALGRGRDGLVNHLDCFACLRAGHAGPAPAPGPGWP